MQEVRDTFVRYIADNLPGQRVHFVRQDSDYPEAQYLETNAINVTFRSLAGDGNVGRQTTVIDLVFEDEDNLIAAYTQLRDILRSSFYTPAYSYAVPSAPVALGYNVIWGRNISFQRVVTEGHLCRYSAQFQLDFYTR